MQAAFRANAAAFAAKQPRLPKKGERNILVRAVCPVTATVAGAAAAALVLAGFASSTVTAVGGAAAAPALVLVWGLCEQLPPEHC